MEKKIKLIHRDGPFGDCTSVYDVEFPQDMTVCEFVTTAVAENPQEWGSFSLGFRGPIVAEYKRGVLQLHPDTWEKYQQRKIAKASSNGGWSLMDYTLELVPEPKPKLEKFFDIFAELTDFPF